MCYSFSPIFHPLFTQTTWPYPLKSFWTNLLPISCFITTLSLISPFQWSRDSVHFSPHLSFHRFATRTVFLNNKSVHIISTPKIFNSLPLSTNKSFNYWVWHLRFFMSLFYFFPYLAWVSMFLVLQTCISQNVFKECGYFEMLLCEGVLKKLARSWIKLPILFHSCIFKMCISTL